MVRSASRSTALAETRVPGPLDPLECCLALSGGRPFVLLDGPEGGGEQATRAYVLFDPAAEVRVAAGSDRRGGTDPLRSLFSALAAAECGAELPVGRFRGGAAGYLAYDVGRHLERLPDRGLAGTRAPDLWFGLFNRGLEIDLATGDGVLFALEVGWGGRRGARYLQEAQRGAVRRLASRTAAPPWSRACASLRSGFTRTRYEAAVSRVQEYIRAGDVYQVNLSQRFEGAFTGDPRAVYARLRTSNPAPFSAFLDTGDTTVLSSSPERFLLLQDGRVETRPIKGTRRRGADPDDDARLRRELEASEKDRAELAMIVDLERNDLGRVCRFGSVEVQSEGHVEAFATVQHRVAVVRGILGEGAGAESLLRAAFPGGSVTGAPRIRAMEIIEELEPVRRGVFTGAIGWIGCQGDLDLNIAIRTMVIEDRLVHFHAGGGIVLDSEPAAEYEETLAKAEALSRALCVSLV